MMRLPFCLLIGVLLNLLGSCSAEGEALVATDLVVAKPRPGMQMTAGYLTLSNRSAQAITISQVTSIEFGSVEMHESVVEDGMARMLPLPELPIAAGQTVKFEPGGKHLMLMQPSNDIESVTLNFYADQALLLTINVKLAD